MVTHILTRIPPSASDFDGRCSCGATVGIQFDLLDFEWSIFHSVPGDGHYHEIRTDTEPVEGLILDLNAAMVNRMPTRAEFDASRALFIERLDRAYSEARQVLLNNPLKTGGESEA